VNKITGVETKRPIGDPALDHLPDPRKMGWEMCARA